VVDNGSIDPVVPPPSAHNATLAVRNFVECARYYRTIPERLKLLHHTSTWLFGPLTRGLIIYAYYTFDEIKTGATIRTKRSAHCAAPTVSHMRVRMILPLSPRAQTRIRRVKLVIQLMIFVGEPQTIT